MAKRQYGYVALVSAGYLGGLVVAAFLVLGSVLNGTIAFADSANTIKVKAGWFEVFGIVKATGEKTRIGDSSEGLDFDVSGYDDFQIHIPPTSLVKIDAIRLGDQWIQSRRGPDFAHKLTYMQPTNEPTAEFGSWKLGDRYTEGPPDGIALQNVIGQDAYYGFRTLGASRMTVFLVD